MERGEAAKLVKAEFERCWPQSSIIPQQELKRLLQHCGVEQNITDKLMASFRAQQGFETDNTPICYKAFIDFVWRTTSTDPPHSKEANNRVLEASGWAESEDNVPKTVFDCKVGGLSVSCWNIKSPELSGNILEMYPGWGTLAEAEHAELLGALFKTASDAILGETSPTLEELLGDQPAKELERIASLRGVESLPLDADEFKEGLKKFFNARLQPARSEQELDSFVQTWLTVPAERWKYWKKQTLRDFVADDGSGGKSKKNSSFPKAKEPNLDGAAWDLSLGLADKHMRYVGDRSARLEFLLLKTDDAKTNKAIDAALQKGACKNDFFKLLVWDLVLVALKARARSSWKGQTEEWDRIYGEIKTQLTTVLDEEKAVRDMVQLVASLRSDIVILSEMSEAMIPDFPEKIRSAKGMRYWMLHAEELDCSSNTVVLVNKEKFPEKRHLEILPFPGEHAKTQSGSKKLRVRLLSRYNSELYVIAAHLSGGEHDMQGFFDALEACLNEDQSGAFIVAGDFNFDLRDERMRSKVLQRPATESEIFDQRPKVKCLLGDSDALWNIPKELGTVSKTRTPFQAQVSKMEMREFSMKDFILVSGNLQPSQEQLKGMITQHRLLPDEEYPSDHSPLTWTVEGDNALQPSSAPIAPKSRRGSLVTNENEVRHVVIGKLGGLNERSLATVQNCIEQVRKAQEVHTLFEMQPWEIQETAADLIEVLNCDDPPPKDPWPPPCCKYELSLKRFITLHEVVASMSGDVLEEHPAKEFDKIDTNKKGSICDAQIVHWLINIQSSMHSNSSHLHRAPSMISDDLEKTVSDVLLRVRAKMEITKYAMAQELMQTMQTYGEAYQELLTKPEGDVDIKNETKEDPPKQPEECDTFEKLAKHGKAIMESVSDFVEEMKNETGAPFWAMGPIKDNLRGQEKIDKDYGGDARRLIDVVRLSMLCKDLHMMKKAIDFVRNDKRFDILRIKSGFDPKSNASVAIAGGYRDVKLNVRHLPSGHVVEIQLHLLLFYVIKQEGGHVLYEWSRKFNVAGIISADDVLSELNPELLEEMATFAQHEFEKANSNYGPESKKTLHKRMSLFQCLGLTKSARDRKDLQEHGKTLLGNIEVLKGGTAIPGRSRYEETEILLMVAKTHECKTDKTPTELLNMAVTRVQEDLKRGLTLREKLFLARCKATLGNALWGSDMKLCIKEFADALRLFKDVGLKDSHPMVAKTKKNYGGALVQAGEIDTAIRELTSALSVFRDLFGPMDHRTAAAVLELGIAFKTVSKEKSLWYLDRCLNARVLRFGEHDSRVGNVYFEIALVDHYHKDWKAAADQFTICKQIWETLGVLDKMRKRNQDKFKLLESMPRE